MFVGGGARGSYQRTGLVLPLFRLFMLRFLLLLLVLLPTALMSQPHVAFGPLGPPKANMAKPKYCKAGVRNVDAHSKVLQRHSVVDDLAHIHVA